jgi:hypothetical protein
VTVVLPLVSPMMNEPLLTLSSRCIAQQTHLSSGARRHSFRSHTPHGLVIGVINPPRVFFSPIISGFAPPKVRYNSSCTFPNSASMSSTLSTSAQMPSIAPLPTAVKHRDLGRGHRGSVRDLRGRAHSFRVIWLRSIPSLVHPEVIVGGAMCIAQHALRACTPNPGGSHSRSL